VFGEDRLGRVTIQTGRWRIKSASLDIRRTKHHRLLRTSRVSLLAVAIPAREPDSRANPSRIPIGRLKLFEYVDEAMFRRIVAVADLRGHADHLRPD
jgi:hypothetical protein